MDNNKVEFINVAAKTRRLLLNAHSNKVFNLDLSPDGGYMVTGSDDKTAKLWSCW